MTAEKIADTDQFDTVKVFNLKAIHGVVENQSATQPYLISIGDRAEEIAQAFEERQMTTQQALGELEKLVSDLKSSRKGAERKRTLTGSICRGLPAATRRRRRVGKVGEQVARAFVANPHRRTSEAQERQLRHSLYAALIDAGVETMTEMTETLMKLLRRASA